MRFPATGMALVRCILGRFLGLVWNWVNKLLILKYGPHGTLLSWTSCIYMFCKSRYRISINGVLSLIEIYKIYSLTQLYYINYIFKRIQELHVSACMKPSSGCILKGRKPLKTKRRQLYLKPQSVPRCKHFSSRL